MRFHPIALVRDIFGWLFDLTVPEAFSLNLELQPDRNWVINFGDFASYQSVRLDIGLSHNAPNSAAWCKADRHCFVIGIEPNRFNMARVSKFGIWSKSHQKPIRRFKPKNFHPILCAIEDVVEPEMRDFYHVRGDPGTSSLLQPNARFFGDTGYTIREVSSVPCIPLRLILEEVLQHFSFVDVIKIDTQGKDLDVLKSAGELIRKVRMVVAEVDAYHYEGAPERSEIFNYLALQGFRPELDENSSPSEDVVFINCHL